MFFPSFRTRNPSGAMTAALPTRNVVVVVVVPNTVKLQPASLLSQPLPSPSPSISRIPLPLLMAAAAAAAAAACCGGDGGVGVGVVDAAVLVSAIKRVKMFQAGSLSAKPFPWII